MPRERAASEMDPVDLIASSNAILPGPTWTFSAKSMRIRITGVIAQSSLRACATRAGAAPSYEIFSSGLNTTCERRILNEPNPRGVMHVDNFFLERQKHRARCGSEHAVVVGDPRGRRTSLPQIRGRKGVGRPLPRPPHRAA